MKNLFKVVLEVEVTAAHVLGKDCITELHPHTDLLALGSSFYFKLFFLRISYMSTSSSPLSLQYPTLNHQVLYNLSDCLSLKRTEFEAPFISF